VIQWLAGVVAPLNHVLFVLGNDAVSWAELLGFVTGGICVWLTVKAHVANFPLGILNSALFLVLFASARLWADASLQLVFVILGFAGWWQWIRGRGYPAGSVGVAGRTLLAVLAAGVVAATIGLTALLRAVHDVAPFWDALTASLSLAAQWLLNAKRIQTWFFWVAADVIYVPLYAVKRLDLTAIVYVLFLGLCVAGWLGWRRTIRDDHVPESRPSVVVDAL
jgi:nicotinamide mononucleotide transporter